MLRTTGSLAYQAAGSTDDVFLGDAGNTGNLQGAVSVAAGSGGSVNLFVDDSSDLTDRTATGAMSAMTLAAAVAVVPPLSVTVSVTV